MSVAGTGVAAAALGGISPRRAIAGPFQVEDFGDFPVPADKKFDPVWIRALTERGEPAVYRQSRGELYFIGMPIGGICTGQLYLGGDGRLWHWDIFNLPAPNEWRSSQGPHYARPVRPSSPIEQGFAIRLMLPDGRIITRPLDMTGFPDIRFKGQYPIGYVEYRDAALPIEVELEAFSPFIPGDADDSGIPCVILNYRVKNAGQAPVEVSVGGWLQNAVCLGGGAEGNFVRVNKVVQRDAGATLMCEAVARPNDAVPTSNRPDILFEDFEKPTYDGWIVTGTAFGDGPCIVKERPTYMGELNAQGERTVNTHQTRNGEDVVRADTHIGTLTSREFTIDRHYIRFRIGGGNHPAQTCVNLLIDGAVVRTATGENRNRMRIEHFDVKEFAGRMAKIQIVDGWTGGWGQIGVDEIVFTDVIRKEDVELESRPDYGSMALAVLGSKDDCGAVAKVDIRLLHDVAVGTRSITDLDIQTSEGSEPFIGAVHRKHRLEPGEAETFRFIVAWHFDGLWWDSLNYLADYKTLRRHYGARFKNAEDVVRYVINNYARLTTTTRLWHRTWYNSTLPHWFLDRTFATVATLATATCYRFNNGRFYGWEGTYCCAGTCTHVWQYAHAVARVFPRLERATREMIDFGTSFHDDTGLIDYRGEAARELAVDGQAGTILRAWREHLMSADDSFLKTIYPRVRKAVELLIKRDIDADGILDGAQYNTLDTIWYGQIPWISSLYLAAVRAAEAMARESGDDEFAVYCANIAESGSKRMVERLFNGEYFVQLTDPAHPEANSTGSGVHADQLLGQSWAHQIGLPRIVPLNESRAALKAIYKYCFTPDIGPYRARFDRFNKGGRWYAMPGEGGLLMCTWPKGGIESAAGKSGDAWAAAYFNECWTGFEYQVASHMICEGLVEEGLAIVRMIHDRHHPSKRNPYNEVECSSHYARAMAGFGVYLAALGFDYHGPKGHLAFAPKLTPENFKAAFITAEGWGTYEQKRYPGRQHCRIALHHGQLRLASLGFDLPEGMRASHVTVQHENTIIASAFDRTSAGVRIMLETPIVMAAAQRLDMNIS